MDKVSRAFTSKAIEMALCTVPGLTIDQLPGKPRPTGVFWPCLVPRDQITHQVHLGDETLTIPPPPCTPAQEIIAPDVPAYTATAPPVTCTLGELAGARSGDKAGNANVGFWVRDPAHLPWLLATVSEPSLRDWLGGFTGPIRIHPLPHMLAVNVELVGWLDRGVAANLAPDPQGKCLAECLRTVQVEVDPALLS
jgi:hypothetical protein